MDIPGNLTASEIGETIHGEDPDEEAVNDTVDLGEEMSTDKKWMSFGPIEQVGCFAILH